MAKCDEGYLCQVCGKAVDGLPESALYLQYVIGWIDPETLHTRRECHLRCQPSLAQFVEHEQFEPVQVEGDFDRRTMDPAFVRERVELISRGYARLVELQKKRKGLTIHDYLLPEFAGRWSQDDKPEH